MSSTGQILERIDDVLEKNKNLQLQFSVCAGALFLCGIAACLLAIFSKQLIWTIPSACTSLFLKWPIEKILSLRKKNIALATVPILITTLSKEDAAKEMQKLIEKLYEQ